MWQKCPLPCIRSFNTGATLFLPYTSCYGANCLQEDYDQCLNTANVAPWVYHTVILASGSALWVLRSEPKPEKYKCSKHNCAGVGGEHCGYYRWGWSSVPLLSSHGEAEYFCINHTWLWHRISPNTDILQSHFYVRESIIDTSDTCLCCVCSVDTLNIWNMKWKEQRKVE